MPLQLLTGKVDSDTLARGQQPVGVGQVNKCNAAALTAPEMSTTEVTCHVKCNDKQGSYNNYSPKCGNCGKECKIWRFNSNTAIRRTLKWEIWRHDERRMRARHHQHRYPPESGSVMKNYQHSYSRFYTWTLTTLHSPPTRPHTISCSLIS